MLQQLALFDYRSEYDWTPSPPPSLSGVQALSLDTETTGLDFRKDKPVGISFCTPDGRCQYLPFGHEGGNLDRESVINWAHRELRNKYIVGANITFDARMLRNVGIDLERQGCVLHDIQHSAALLDEYRQDFYLETLGKDFVGRGKRRDYLDKSRMAEYHSSQVAPYAEEDVRLTLDVHKVQQVRIHDEGLNTVRELEDKLNWANIDIEANGARLDVPKLLQWRAEVAAEMSKNLLQLKAPGQPWSALVPMDFKVNSSKKWDILFHNLELPSLDEYTASEIKKVNHPVTPLALKARKQQALLSNYLDKYASGKDRHGMPYRVDDYLRFALHPLRGDEEGTVSGRYSSSNVNIQQVFRAEHQVKELGPGHIIRELFIPDEGFIHTCSDASQIEFRLFAHYSQSRELLEKYNNDPTTDFYNAVVGFTGQTRQDAKVTALGSLYGMGLEKLAKSMGKSCDCGFGLKCKCDLPAVGWVHQTNCGKDPSNHVGCPAQDAIRSYNLYNEKFPAAKKLFRKVYKAADERGYVLTTLGRRARFVAKYKLHSALNRVIQGTAADILKLKLLQVYENRHTLGIHKLRYPVHDEINSDMSPDPKFRKVYEECMAESVASTSVPILWKHGYGADWAEAKG